MRRRASIQLVRRGPSPHRTPGFGAARWYGVARLRSRCRAARQRGASEVPAPEPGPANCPETVGGVCGTIARSWGRARSARGRERLVLGTLLGRVRECPEGCDLNGDRWPASSAGPIRFPAPAVPAASGHLGNGQYTVAGSRASTATERRCHARVDFAVLVDHQLGAWSCCRADSAWPRLGAARRIASAHARRTSAC